MRHPSGAQRSEVSKICLISATKFATELLYFPEKRAFLMLVKDVRFALNFDTAGCENKISMTFLYHLVIAEELLLNWGASV